jgi:DNA replication and repair protein RecF
MFLKNLFLRNFRNYSSFNITFSPRLNVICGPNAIGKTNILEAIYLLSTGRSFLTLNLQDLIKHKENFFYIEANIETEVLQQTIKIYYDGKTKKITHNSNVYPSFTSLLGLLPSSLYSIDDLNLIKGKPIIRRKFFNLHLAQKDPLYVHHFSRFYKGLKQRNHLLKTNKLHLLKPFDIELCKSGSYLIYARKNFIDMLQKPIHSFISKLTDMEMNLKLKYISPFTLTNDLNEITQKYLEELTKNQKKDLDFKTTLIGPHRDDYHIFVNNKAAKDFASEAQKKLILYALRFAEWDLLNLTNNQKALMLIDDFDAHLDEKHKNKLKNVFQDFSQTFITVPKIDEKFENANIINILNNAN